MLIYRDALSVTESTIANNRSTPNQQSQIKKSSMSGRGHRLLDDATVEEVNGAFGV
jgi:hypothetical protein